MKVRATRLGFYDLKRRKEGETFILHDPKLFSDKWMECLDDVKPAKKAKVKKPAAVVEPEVSSEDDVI